MAALATIIRSCARDPACWGARFAVFVDDRVVCHAIFRDGIGLAEEPRVGLCFFKARARHRAAHVQSFIVDRRSGVAASEGLLEGCPPAALLVPGGAVAFTARFAALLTAIDCNHLSYSRAKDVPLGLFREHERGNCYRQAPRSAACVSLVP